MKLSIEAKIFHYILTILGFAGVVSCEPVCMYGTPTMDFEVSGKVVNQDSAPIAGIKVSCRVFADPDVATALTADDGSFIISGTGMSPLLEFKDIDGTENGGEFADKIEEIKVEQVKEGDGNWYMGKYEARGVVIEMEEK